MHGQALAAPAETELAPDARELAWHRENVFLG
jgi:hypothetical protein